VKRHGLVVPEHPLQKQIADALRLEIAPPGKVSSDGVVGGGKSDALIIDALGGRCGAGARYKRLGSEVSGRRGRILGRARNGAIGSMCKGRNFSAEQRICLVRSGLFAAKHVTGKAPVE
jgi:hypothetical protein